MPISDISAADAQAFFIPKCVYCNGAMTRILKDTLTNDVLAEKGGLTFAILECKDCGWEVVVPWADKTTPQTCLP